jgi:hypothetical protein
MSRLASTNSRSPPSPVSSKRVYFALSEGASLLTAAVMRAAKLAWLAGQSSCRQADVENQHITIRITGMYGSSPLEWTGTGHIPTEAIASS